ncbi:MAG: ArsR family transcriptional regulator [Thermosphaera sp.]
MKYSPGYWRLTPLFRMILEIVIDHPEGISESDLIDSLKKEHEVDVNRAELYKALMKLELSGYIQVEHVGRELVVRLSPAFPELFK